MCLFDAFNPQITFYFQIVGVYRQINIVYMRHCATFLKFINWPYSLLYSKNRGVLYPMVTER